MTGGVPDDSDGQSPSEGAVDGHERPSMGRVTPLRVVFITLVVIAIAVAIVGLFYGGLPSDG